MNTELHSLIVGVFLASVPPTPLSAGPLDTWHVRNPPSSPTGSLAAVTYGSGQFVAVGYNGFTSSRDWIFTSPDGAIWTEHSSGATNQLTAIAHGNGIFVALGRQYLGGGQPDSATIVTSTDGTAWRSQGTFADTTLEAVTYGNGVFVAVGRQDAFSGVILTSSNETSWTSQTLGTSSLRLVAYGNRLFVVIGNPVLTSEDGNTWTDRGSPPGGWALAYGGGLFVVISGEANFPAKGIYASSDAEHWTYRGFLAGADWRGPGFTYGNGTFVLLGSGGAIAYSSDLNSMSMQQRTLGNYGLRGVTYGRGTFVVVGDQGAILQSDPLPTARLTAGALSDQGLLLTISGEEGLSYRLQATSELPSTNRTDLLTYTNTASATNFVDTDATNFNRRIYRVVSP